MAGVARDRDRSTPSEAPAGDQALLQAMIVLIGILAVLGLAVTLVTLATHL